MIYCFGECELNTHLYSVQRGGQTFRLRPKVFRACLYLLEHRDRVVSREELCAQVWPGRFVSQATLEGVIRSLRQAVGDSGRAQGIILTLHGYGYRFAASVEERPTEGDASSVASVLAPAAVHGSGGLGEPGQEMPAPNEDAADGRSASVLRDWRLMRQHLPGEWRVMRLGLALVMAMLVLLGGWGLWREIWGHTAVVLDKSRIAVLPFIDLSAEANQAYFADGMTEELIVRLAQTQGLTVIARRSVMKYKDTKKDIGTIGRELGVGTILRGSVQKVNNEIRINAELIDVASQSHLWSQEYDRELTEVFSVQSDVATRMAQRLKMQLAAGEKRRVELPAQLEQGSL